MAEGLGEDGERTLGKLWELIGDYVALSSVDREVSENADVRELMCELRRWGFDSGELSRLSGYPEHGWDASSVRVYSMGWGVKDVGKVRVKTSLMGVLRGAVSGGHGLGDLAWMRRAESSMRSKGSSLEEVAELNGLLGDVGVERGEVKRLVNVARQLSARGFIVEDVEAWIKLDGQLSDEGFDSKMRGKLSLARDKFGGLEPALDAVMKEWDARAAERRKEEAEKQLMEINEVCDSWMVKAEKEKEKYEEYKDANEAVDTLLGWGWKLLVIAALPEVFRESETPKELRENVGIYRRKLDLEMRIEGLKQILASYQDLIKKAELSVAETIISGDLMALASGRPTTNNAKSYFPIVIKIMRNVINAWMIDPRTTEQERMGFEELRSMFEGLPGVSPLDKPGKAPDDSPTA